MLSCSANQDSAHSIASSFKENLRLLKPYLNWKEKHDSRTKPSLLKKRGCSTNSNLKPSIVCMATCDFYADCKTKLLWTTFRVLINNFELYFPVIIVTFPEYQWSLFLGNPLKNWSKNSSSNFLETKFLRRWRTRGASFHRLLLCF